MTADEPLTLFGYNFWDVRGARIGLVRLLDGVSQWEANPTAEPNPVRIDPKNDCGRPSLTFTELYAEGLVPDEATVDHLNVSPGYFYAVRFFNENGSYLADHDAKGMTNPDPPRTLHTCWAGCSGGMLDCPAVCSSPTDTDCAISDCTSPGTSQTCAVDSEWPTGACTGAWNTAPRTLDTLDGSGPQLLCSHDPFEPAPCRETPQWFGNNPKRNLAIVFVQPRSPRYEVSARLDAVKCVEESGWSSPGDDEFEAHLTMLPTDRGSLADIAEGSVGAILANGEHARYDGDYDEGEFSHGSFSAAPGMQGVRTLGALNGRVRFSASGGAAALLRLRESDATEASLHNWIWVVHTAVNGIVTAAGVLAGDGYSQVAAGIASTITTSIRIAATGYETGDSLGDFGFVLTPTEFNQRIAGTHADAFRTQGPLERLTYQDGSLWGASPRDVKAYHVLHPTDFTNEYYSNLDRNTCPALGAPLVPVGGPETCQTSDSACYFGRCIGGNPFVEANMGSYPTADCSSDPTCNRGYRQRIRVARSRHSSDYQLDFTLTMQRESAPEVFDEDPL